MTKPLALSELARIRAPGVPAGLYVTDHLTVTVVGNGEGFSLVLHPDEAVALARRLLDQCHSLRSLATAAPAGEA